MPSDEYPRRDLFLSPHHSLFIEGLLIPIEWLTNGKTITLAEMDDCEAIQYFHIELETHEVIFAEGAPAETLLVTTIASALGILYNTNRAGPRSERREEGRQESGHEPQAG